MNKSILIKENVIPTHHTKAQVNNIYFNLKINFLFSIIKNIPILLG